MADINARPAKAARRVALTAVAPAEPSSIAHAPTVSLSDSTNFEMSFKPAATVAVHSMAELSSLLKASAQEVHQTRDAWACTPRAKWIAALIAELRDDQLEQLRLRQRTLQTTAADDFGTRWELGSQFASAVIELWLDGRSLDEVLETCRRFGHEKLKCGVILSGALIREWAAKEDVTLASLMPMVASLAAKEKSASLYRVQRANHFKTEGNASAQLDELEAELKDRLDSGRGGCGSLNTTFHYAEEADTAESAVPLLDGLMHQLDDLQLMHPDPSSWRLNHRLYLIWKLQGYCTPYHQDVHVPPHFTLYNQVDGVSTFHFLPLLVGLFATHVGRRSADELAVLLRTLRERGVGEVATLGPKQMLLIFPSGAHGVFVPRTTPPANAPLPRFDFSVIRAAEIFAWPTHEHYEAALMAEGEGDAAWCSFLPMSDAERAEEERRSRRFEEHQAALIDEMRLTREDWLLLAMRMQRRWERERATTASSEAT
ncbi:hypothetical protein PPROV_000659100 [Pycnococcus provasolii]|uniref:Uncharacterized protein n=1 Tax=Pycnococcus provasolii TaxID=41880 RepID=A0A830HS85_9CHLO|nr:hypothetical protein PPROV_000659100 [Pycnococcus provasolii]|mmetsp:Transcript_2729/g.7446  ORF Transcript_2729/g.7446 Transcript_2729/m.7446 type:complete len:487 (-) Transcript_2729:88-1548(-)